MTRLTAFGSLAVACAACNGIITADTEKAWQSSFSAALVPGYTDFRGLDYSADAGVSIFAYRLPNDEDPSRVILLLRQRVAAANSCFSVIREDAYQLQMRCPTSTYGANGFDEYRIAVDAVEHRVIVMAGGFDSRVEIEDYPAFEKTFLMRAAQKPSS